MKATEAILTQKELETILKRNDIHYKVQYVRNPKLKFINMEVSIKITKD